MQRSTSKPTPHQAQWSKTNISHVAVVIPAHNEARRIDATLANVTRAAHAVSGRVSTSILVVADACTDSTAGRAALRLSTPPDIVVRSDHACAGSARRAGVSAAFRGASVPLSRIWLASTDADTLVPEDWIEKQLSAAASGLDGIAGIVTLIPDADADATLVDRFSRYYSVDGVGTHNHVHAANLGMRADAYAEVGGWSPIATGEDHDLWGRLARQGFALGSSSSLTVSTSARRSARAPRGFAADLRRLDREVEVA